MNHHEVHSKYFSTVSVLLSSNTLLVSPSESIPRDPPLSSLHLNTPDLTP